MTFMHQLAQQMHMMQQLLHTAMPATYKKSYTSCMSYDVKYLYVCVVYVLVYVASATALCCLSAAGDGLGQLQLVKR